MKQLFILAYCYCYGATKRQAAAAYKNATPDYIQEIIKAYNQDARNAFYND